MAFGRLGTFGTGFGRLGHAPRTPWWLAGSTLDLDFAKNRARQAGRFYMPSALLTTTRASDAYADDTAGNWTLFASGVPRITNKGLLVEESRTNSIRNNSMQGAVAGTPGTAPTNWTILGTGLTIQLVGTGTSNGIDYVDYRFSGTTGAAFGTIVPEASSIIVASNSQVWTQSVFLAIVGGSTTNISALSLTTRQQDSGGATLSDLVAVANALTGLTSSLQRVSGTTTNNNASTAYVRPLLGFTWSNGVAIDITLRIGWPQLELGAFATSPIRTTAAAATRAADAITVNNFSSWFNQSAGTIYVEALLDRTATTNSFLCGLSDGTTNEETFLMVTNGAAFQMQVTDGGVAQAAPFGGAQSAGVAFKFAAAYAANDGRIALNGSSVGTPDVSMTLPTVDRLRLGSRHNDTFYLGGCIKRIVYKPIADTTAQLQAITT